MTQWSSIFKAQRSTYSQILCYVSAKFVQHIECNEAWKNRVSGVRVERNYSDFDDVKGESAEFEWNISQGSQRCSFCGKISNLPSSLGQTPESFTGILFMSMFNDIFCDRYDNKDECLRNANIVKTYAGRFGIGQWSFIGPGSILPRIVHKELGTMLRKRCSYYSQKVDILSFVQRLHCPEGS